MANLISATTIEAAVKSEKASIEELQIKAACYDWLVSGQRVRQGQVIPNFGTRQIDKDSTKSLLSFSYWCSIPELTATIASLIAKG